MSSITRRSFVKAAAVVGAAAYAFPWSKAFASPDADGKYWAAELGGVSDMKSSTPKFTVAKYKNAKGELMDEQKIYVRWQRKDPNSNEGTWVILSAICSHLKCKIEFNGDLNRFKCPCHKSEFDLTGKVQKKPAKKDLADFSSMAYVENDTLYLRKLPD